MQVSCSLELGPVISQTQPDHLQLEVDSPVHSRSPVRIAWWCCEAVGGHNVVDCRKPDRRLIAPHVKQLTAPGHS